MAVWGVGRGELARVAGRCGGWAGAGAAGRSRPSPSGGWLAELTAYPSHSCAQIPQSADEQARL